MNLGKGNTQIAYAKVPARVAEFHKDNKNGKIETSFEFKDSQLIFRAVVTPDLKNAVRTFNGTSFGKVLNDKALEKLETVAVGRALAFAGYLADGEIASSEEMDKYETEDVVSEEDILAYADKLDSAQSIEELSKFWADLPAKVKVELKRKKDEIKENFQSVQKK